MISAYRENWQPCTCSFEKYVTNSVVTRDAETAIETITDYLADNSCSSSVVKFLHKVLFTPEVLGKIQIVIDGSGRNVVFLVRPDGISFTGYADYNFKSYEEGLLAYSIQAEIIFLNLDDQTWAEIDAEENEWDDPDTEGESE